MHMASANGKNDDLLMDIISNRSGLSNQVGAPNSSDVPRQLVQLAAPPLVQDDSLDPATSNYEMCMYTIILFTC